MSAATESVVTDPIIRIENLTKRFPGVVALDRVSMSIQRGAAQALIGENGAGKSTLGRAIAGIHAPDDGVIRLDGHPLRLNGPLDAMRAGIGLVHQELSFCPNMTVAENLLLGELPRRGWRLDRRALRARARECLERVGCDVDPDRPMSDLSIAQEQMVQIAAAARVGARVLVLDEPTSSLSSREAEQLFALMADLKRRGTTLIYVSHRMSELFAHCDLISVLRDGRHVATLRTADTSPDEVVRHMIGRPVSEYFPQHAAAAPGPVVVEVRGLSSPGGFRDVSFELRRGEIVGLAGLVGAGRSEVAHALFGLDSSATGTVRIAGREGLPGGPTDALRRGIAYLPEDRKRQGLVLSLGGRTNLSLAILSRLSRLRFVRQRRERELAREYFRRLSIRAPDYDAAVSGLSGGNQQKVALAKWLAAECPALIVDEPTRGVDVGAKAEIHALLDRLAADGAAILLISSELPELLALAGRIIVLRAGRVVGELSRAEATQESLMRLMAGVAAA